VKDTKTLSNADRGRITYIEGLKGFAALIVVTNHIASLFDLYTVISEATAASPLIRFLHVPIQFLLNGQFSVVLFFLLSGYLIGNRYFTSENKPSAILRTGIRRYFTLVFPCAVSVLAGYIAVRFSLTSAHLVNPNYTHWLFEPNLSEAIRNGLWGIFIGDELPYSYNISLWTIKYELPGTFLTLALLSMFGTFSKRYWVYLSILLFLITKDAYHCYHICFVIGLMMNDIEHNAKHKCKWPGSRFVHVFMLIVCVGGCY